MLKPWPLFMDSGAFSLYNQKVLKNQPSTGGYQPISYDFFTTSEFWEYVDNYAKFIQANRGTIQLYANVDVMYNPTLSWEVLKYLEEEHGLHPVPVVHLGTDLKWIDRHLEAGYKCIGLGGLAQPGVRGKILAWVDRVFTKLCPAPERLPIIRVHGFGVGSPALMKRYPWWSVDSASWVKVAGFGGIYVPRWKNGAWDFVHFFKIFVSEKSPTIKRRGQHVLNISREEQACVQRWLQEIDVVLGDLETSKDEQTAINHRSVRTRANLFFFRGLAHQLEWPRPFKVRGTIQGFAL